MKTGRIAEIGPEEVSEMLKIVAPAAAIPCGCNYTWGMLGQPVLRPCPAHLAARCTCPTMWFGIVPPPPCPVHGQVSGLTVTC